MNKKAGEKYLSPWLIFIWIIIFGGVVASVFLVYSAYLDVREEEADILNVRIADCLIDNGYFKGQHESLFTECGLDENMLDKSNKYYLHVSVTDFDSNVIWEISKGVPDFEKQCAMGKDFAVCNEKTFYALDKLDNNKKFLIKILTASNQRGKQL